MTGGTPSQTAGPFVSIGTSWNAGLSSGAATLRGRVRDGDGAPVTDAMLEFWCAGSFARALTDGEGCYEVRVEDGVTDLDVSIFARGLMQRLVTRVYLSDEDDGLDAAVRHRLLARPDAGGDFVFDIKLRGDDETVFFAPWPT